MSINDHYRLLAKLVEVLSDLISEKATIKQVATDAGVSWSDVKQEGALSIHWMDVIRAAQCQGVLLALIARCVRQYQHSEKLKQIHQEFEALPHDASAGQLQYQDIKAMVIHAFSQNTHAWSAFFLIYSLARLCDRRIPWSFDVISLDSCDDEIAEELVSWAIEHPNAHVFAAWLLTLEARANQLDAPDAAKLFAVIAEQWTRLRGLSLETTRMMATQVDVLYFQSIAGGVIQVQSDNATAEAHAYMRIPGLKPILLDVEGTSPGTLIEAARNDALSRAELSVIPHTRVEVFVAKDQIEDPWEFGSNGAFHSVPVVVRPNRRPTDWEHICFPEAPIPRDELLCCLSCSDQTEESLKRVRVAGAFIASLKSKSSDRFHDLILFAAVGIWLRGPGFTSDDSGDVESILAGAKSVDVDALPTMVHEHRRENGRRNIVVMYGTRDTEFPQQRKNVQLRLAGQL